MEFAIWATFFIPIVLLVLLFIFYVLVHPAWAIIDSVMDPNQPKNQKLLLSAIIFFAGPLGSLIYVGFVSKTPRLRKATLITLILIPICLLIPIVMLVLVPDVKAKAGEVFGEVMTKNATVTVGTPTAQ